MNRRSRLFVLGLLLIQGGTAMSCRGDISQDSQEISDSHSRESDVVSLINKLREKPPAKGEAKLWADIANSSKYSDVRRRRAIFELFDRHVHPGMTLSDLAVLLRSPPWLENENVSIVNILAGKIPISIVSGETVFVVMIKLPKDDVSAVYLRTQDSPSLDSFCEGMRGNKPDVGALKITAIGIFAPDADDQKLITGRADK